jgi:hypothetical protein
MFKNILDTSFFIITILAVVVVHGCDQHDSHACEATSHRYNGHILACLNGGPDEKLVTCRTTKLDDVNSAAVHFAELTDKNFNTFCLYKDYVELLACDTVDACKCSKTK